MTIPMSEKRARAPWFVRIGTDLYSRSKILSVRKTTPSKGKDGVVREWVVTVDPECVGGVLYNKIWITDEEALVLQAKLLGEGTGKQ